MAPFSATLSGHVSDVRLGGSLTEVELVERWDGLADLE